MAEIICYMGIVPKPTERGLFQALGAIPLSAHMQSKCQEGDRGSVGVYWINLLMR